MKPSTKPAPPRLAAKRLNLTIGETEAIGYLAFQMAGPESSPFDALEALAVTWHGLVSEISPPPKPRPST